VSSGRREKKSEAPTVQTVGWLLQVLLLRQYVALVVNFAVVAGQLLAIRRQAKQELRRVVNKVSAICFP